MEKILRYYKGLRKIAEPIYTWQAAFGIDLRKFVRALHRLPYVIKEYHILRLQNKAVGSKCKLKLTMPAIDDRYSAGGIASGHYFHQDLLVARKIFKRQPFKHVDIGSRIDGFVSHVAVFRAIEVLDIRPLDAQIQNVTFKQSDLMNPAIDLIDYCDSLSCLHALEHFGLGRYGDPIDIDGHMRGFDNFHKILQPNGILYLSVPIGPDRIDFNSHRVFSIKTILEMAKDRFELIGFSYVDDNGDLNENVIIASSDDVGAFGCYYGCGIFEFRKLSSQR